MTVDDFWPLMNEFNTVPSAIQNYGDYRHDFEEMARKSESVNDFKEALRTHRKNQLRYWKGSLQHMSEEVGISHNCLPTELWHDVLDLLSQGPRPPSKMTEGESEVGWQSPVSLQGLIEVLQHFQQRIIPSEPLLINPPTPALSPSTIDSPSPSYDDLYLPHRDSNFTRSIEFSPSCDTTPETSENSSRSYDSVSRPSICTDSSFHQDSISFPSMETVPPFETLATLGTKSSHDHDSNSITPINLLPPHETQSSPLEDADMPFDSKPSLASNTTPTSLQNLIPSSHLESSPSSHPTERSCRTLRPNKQRMKTHIVMGNRVRKQASSKLKRSSPLNIATQSPRKLRYSRDLT